MQLDERVGEIEREREREREGQGEGENNNYKENNSINYAQETVQFI